MVFGIFKSISKSKKLVEYSNILIENSFDSEIHDEALSNLINLAFEDKNCLKIIYKHNITREQMKEKYQYVLNMGLSVSGGHYIPASSLVFSATLDFLFDASNINQKLEGQELRLWIAYLLMTYYEEGKTGSVI
jgi:hypothetical protein